MDNILQYPLTDMSRAPHVRAGHVQKGKRGKMPSPKRNGAGDTFSTLGLVAAEGFRLFLTSQDEVVLCRLGTESGPVPAPADDRSNLSSATLARSFPFPSSHSNRNFARTPCFALRNVVSCLS